MSLPEAYEKQRVHLPKLYQALIRVGIASGDLPAVLDEIAEHADQRAGITARFHKALFYPLVSGIGVLALAAAVFFYVGPTANSLSLDRLLNFDELGGWKGPRADWVGRAQWIALGGFALFFVGFSVFVWCRNPLDGRTGPKGLRFRFPFVGRLRTYAAKAGFAATMAMLIKRGLPLPESLQLAAAAADDPRVAEQIDVMRANAESGENLATSVEAGGFLSPSMLWFVENGEANGAPAAALADVAKVYRRRFERSVDKLCFFVQPIALLLLGLVVTAFAFAVVLPMYSSFGRLWGG